MLQQQVIIGYDHEIHVEDSKMGERVDPLFPVFSENESSEIPVPFQDPVTDFAAPEERCFE